jgi:hypothetical protein
MKIINIVFVALLSLLGACGGGGESEETQPNNTVVAAPPLPLQTKDLVAPDGFNYQSSADVSLMVDIDALANNRSFVSVYSEYEKNAQNEWVPNFDSRLIFERLAGGRLERSFKMTKDINRVLIQVWTVGSQDGPLVYETTIEGRQINWRL